MDRIFIDYVGKFPSSKSGNFYILTAVDSFTKFVWMFPVRDSNTNITIECLKKIFAVVGFPRSLVSDNASYFVSRKFNNFCFDLGIRHITTSPYFPQASLVERFNRNLKAALIAYHSEDHSSWDKNLYWLQFAFNTAKHEAHLFPPISLMLGFRPNNPLCNLWSINDLLPDHRESHKVKDMWKRASANHNFP